MCSNNTTAIMTGMKNCKVVWVRPNQQFNVGECYDKPAPICHAYKRRMENDPKYVGGILCVVSMPVHADNTPSM